MARAARETEPRGLSGGEACRSFQATGVRRPSGVKRSGAGRRGKLTEQSAKTSNQGIGALDLSSARDLSRFGNNSNF